MTKQVICDECGKQIIEKIYHAKGYEADFCSVECVAKAYCPTIRTEEIKR